MCSLDLNSIRSRFGLYERSHCGMSVGKFQYMTVLMLCNQICIMLWMVLLVQNVILRLDSKRDGWLKYHRVIIGKYDQCLGVVSGDSFVGANESLCDIRVLRFVRCAWGNPLVFAMCKIASHSFCLCKGLEVIDAFC